MGDRSVQLLKMYGEETKKLRDKGYVPYTLINGKERDLNKALKQQVCIAFKNPPKECDGVLKL